MIAIVGSWNLAGSVAYEHAPPMSCEQLRQQANIRSFGVAAFLGIRLENAAVDARNLAAGYSVFRDMCEFGFVADDIEWFAEEWWRRRTDGLSEVLSAAGASLSPRCCLTT
jgi:hypothetical protein